MKAPAKGRTTAILHRIAAQDRRAPANLRQPVGRRCGVLPARRELEGKTVHADRGYRSEEVREMIKAKGLIDAVQRQDDPKCHDQSEIYERNRILSKIRACVEHVFGDWAQSSGKTLRCIGKVRAKAQTNIRACAYHLRRWKFLVSRGACGV